MTTDPPILAITPAGRKLVAVWSVALLLLFAGLGLFTATKTHEYKAAASIRHAARIDPHAVEPGRTAADGTLPADANPRRVTVGMYLDNIASISVLDATWSPVFYIWFRWADDDIHPGETFKIVEGEIVSKEKLIDQVTKGEHYALYLVRAQITKYFSADRYPVDDHLLTVAIEDGALPWRELEYVPDTANSNVSSRVKMPGYAVHKTGLVMKPHTYKTNFGEPGMAADTRHTYAQLIYGVWNVRPSLGPYLKNFVGLYAAVFIALLAFLIKCSDFNSRIGLGVGGFFGAVANTLLSASLVPESGILTLMDMVNGVGMITITLALVQSNISLYLYDVRGETALSGLFDRASFAVFVIGFAVINVIIPLIGMVR